MKKELEIKKNINLSPYTTFHIGGVAENFVEVKELDELIQAIEYAKKEDLEARIFSGGSNILVSDGTIKGLVIKLGNDKVEFHGDRVVAGAGVGLISLARNVAGQSLTGLEWAAGIPGSIGGALVMNAKAFGGEMSSVVETVSVLNAISSRTLTLSNRDCNFSYKHSIFSDKKEYLIWDTTLKLARGGKKEIAELMEGFIGKRNSKQPKLPSAGCAFKNVEAEEVRENNPELFAEAESRGAIIGGRLAAAWIIDRMGLKGKTMGGAKISLEHANFIVNTGNATASDVVKLLSYIKQQIRDELKLQLHEEVIYFGF